MGKTLDQESEDLNLIQAGPSEGLSSLYFSHLLMERFRIEALEGILWGFPVAQLVKKPPAMQETLVRFPGWGKSCRKGIGYPL